MLKCFSVYDSKAAAFVTPFFCANAAIAIRSFEHAANNEGHDFHRFGADYTLFELGEFQDESGHFNMHAQPLNLGTASSFIRPLNTKGA